MPWEPAKDDLETRVRRVETELTNLKLEWGEVLDKLLHRLQRQSKRDRDAAVRALETAPTGNAGTTAPDSPALQGRAERLAAARARLLTKGRGNGWLPAQARSGDPEAGSGA
jgi:hypothetical protein